MKFFSAFFDSQNYKNLAYNLLAFPLGIVYFVIIVTGLSLSAGLLVIWAGLFVFAALFFTIRAFGHVEQALAKGLLSEEIPFAAPFIKTKGFWAFFGGMLKNGSFWKNMLFQFLKFPLGIFSFTLCVTLFSTSLGLLATPILYFIIPHYMNYGFLFLRIIPLPLTLVLSVGAGLLLYRGSLFLSNVMARVYTGIAGAFFDDEDVDDDL